MFCFDAIIYVIMTIMQRKYCSWTLLKANGLLIFQQVNKEGLYVRKFLALNL